MCLGTITRKAKESTGYKFMMRHCGDHVTGLFKQQNIKYAVGKWTGATSEGGKDIVIPIFCPNPNEEYGFGFHIFPNIQNAKKFFDEFGHRDDMVLVKVSYRGVVAQGIDHSSHSIHQKKIRCVVAAQMRVDEIISTNDIEKYINDLMPKPKRRTITVGEFVDAYNKAADIEDLLHIVNSRLGYDVLQQQEKLRYKAKKSY